MKEIDDFIQQISSLSHQNTAALYPFLFQIDKYVQNIEPHMDNIQNTQLISKNIHSAWQVFDNASKILQEIAIEEQFIMNNEPFLTNFDLFTRAIRKVCDRLVQSKAMGIFSVFPAIHQRISKVFLLGSNKLYSLFEEYMNSFKAISSYADEEVQILTQFCFFLSGLENDTGSTERSAKKIYTDCRMRIVNNETFSLSTCILECTKAPYIKGTHPFLTFITRIRELVDIESKNAFLIFPTKLPDGTFEYVEISNSICSPLQEEAKNLLFSIMDKVKKFYEPAKLYFDSVFITIDIGSFFNSLLSEKSVEDNTEDSPLHQSFAPLARQLMAFNVSIIGIVEGEIESALSSENLSFPTNAAVHIICIRTMHFCKKLVEYSEITDELIMIGKGGKYKDAFNYCMSLLNYIISKLENAFQKYSIKNPPFLPSLELSNKNYYYWLVFSYNCNFCFSLRFQSNSIREKLENSKMEILNLFDFSQQFTSTKLKSTEERFLIVIGIIENFNLYDSDLKDQIDDLLVRTFLPTYMQFITSGKKTTDQSKKNIKFPTYSSIELSVQKAFQC